jgi:hypothetical protein
MPFSIPTDTKAAPPIPKTDSTAPATFMPPPRRASASQITTLRIAILAVVGVALAALAYLRLNADPATPVAAAPAARVDGVATIISRPEGAQVIVDGTVRGVTPLKLTLPVGSHRMELVHETGRRALPLVIENGTAVREYVDLAPASGATGRLEVTSEPAGAQVMIDGAARGTTPLVLSEIEPGQHKVTIVSAEATVNRTVDVAPGMLATVVATLAPAGVGAGWISLKSPIEMQILEGGRVLGTTASERLMLPAGRHELELVATAFDFRTKLTMQVNAGRTSASAVDLPTQTLSLNATPWAEVWVDGQSVGTTPLGNLSVTIGSHEIVWRHPQLGERRQTIVVKPDAPFRAAMDFRK